MLLVEVDVPDVVDAVVDDVSVVEVRVVLELSVVELPVELRVALVVDDSVDVVRPSHMSSHCT